MLINTNSHCTCQPSKQCLQTHTVLCQPSKQHILTPHLSTIIAMLINTNSHCTCQPSKQVCQHKLTPHLSTIIAMLINLISLRSSLSRRVVSLVKHWADWTTCVAPALEGNCGHCTWMLGWSEALRGFLRSERKWETWWHCPDVEALCKHTCIHTFYCSLTLGEWNTESSASFHRQFSIRKGVSQCWVCYNSQRLKNAFT